MSFLKILSDPKIIKFLTKFEAMENPEFKIGEFKIDGKVWIGFLIREKEKGEK